MRRSTTEDSRLLMVAALCQQAIQGQRQREASQGYGLDDYTEGRIVGAANLARKIMRIVSGDQPDAAGFRALSRGESAR